MPCKNHTQVLDNVKPCARCGADFCPDCIVELKQQFYCADCKVEQVKDIQSGADATQLDNATIGKRFAAVFIDGLIMLIPIGLVYALGIFVILAAVQNQIASFVFQIVLGIMLAIPMVIYEGLMLSNQGQTVGKKVMKIKVVTADGQDITGGQAWGRSVMRAVFNQLSIFGLVNYLVAFSSERTTLHDRIAKTRVINWN